jgi:hypothetical protein
MDSHRPFICSAAYQPMKPGSWRAVRQPYARVDFILPVRDYEFGYFSSNYSTDHEPSKFGKSVQSTYMIGILSRRKDLGQSFVLGGGGMSMGKNQSGAAWKRWSIDLPACTLQCTL